MLALEAGEDGLTLRGGPKMGMLVALKWLSSAEGRI
jgi:hypothetical protein